MPSLESYIAIFNKFMCRRGVYKAKGNYIIYCISFILIIYISNTPFAYTCIEPYIEFCIVKVFIQTTFKMQTSFDTIEVIIPKIWSPKDRIKFSISRQRLISIKIKLPCILRSIIRFIHIR